MLTHGSDCQRAWSGPFDALVEVSVEEGRRRGFGTLPKLITWRCYSTGKRVSSTKAALREGQLEEPFVVASYRVA
jgi:hypothetical protein